MNSDEVLIWADAALSAVVFLGFFICGVMFGLLIHRGGQYNFGEPKGIGTRHFSNLPATKQRKVLLGDAMLIAVVAAFLAVMAPTIGIGWGMLSVAAFLFWKWQQLRKPEGEKIGGD
ncbi:MAG: hypothetical protein ACR2P4_01785 [Gammaproteobacteria bacterium]